MLRKMSILVLLVFAISGCSSNDTEGILNPDFEGAREIVVNASQFEFSPNAITVKQGEKVKIKVNNTDALHNLVIPGLNYYEANEEFLLDTTKKGEYDFACATMCGGGYFDMVGKIIIE